MKQLPYLTVRDRVKTGDGLFVVGKSLLSKGIELFSDFSHVALIVRYDDIMPHYYNESVQTIEALVEGVESYDFIVRVQHECASGSELYWLPVLLSDEQRSLCREFALSEIPKHRPYGVGTLLQNAFGYQPIATKESRICSEWYATALISCGFVDWHIAPRPGDIPHWLGDKAEDLVKIIGPKCNEIVSVITSVSPHV